MKRTKREVFPTKKRLLSILGFLLILALCAFIVLSLTSGMRKNAKVLTYAEVNPLDGTIVGEMAKAFKEKTEELSGGRLLIDIQAGGVLGSEDQILDNLLGGGNICDITRISAFALTQYGCEKVSQFFISDIPDIRDYMVEMNTLPAMVYGVGVFTLISACCGERETKSRTAAMLSQQSFGIYITHVFVLDILIGVLLPYTVFQEQHPLLYTLVVFILAFGLSLLLTWGLSKIKGREKTRQGIKAGKNFEMNHVYLRKAAPFMKKQIAILTILALLLCGISALAETDLAAEGDGGINYLALVNKLHPLPEGWEEALETVTITNSVGDEVEVEARAYAAYLLLKADLEEKDGIYLELDSARRSVAAQQDIMDRFIEKYGADYAAKTVATPGYSEHHTGLALDLYFRIKNDDGTFTDVYYNEDMTKPEYEGLWATVHAKLADYGFILRYLEGKEYITGYGYEPWHIRYIDDADMAKEIMAPPGMTLEVWLGAATDADVAVDYGISELYTPEELKEAAVQVKCRFASFAGCELHTLRYAGDECNTDENLAWMNHLDEGKGYVQVAEFISDFHSPLQPGDDEAWEADKEYTAWQWWLARTAEGGWQLLTWGY